MTTMLPARPMDNRSLLLDTNADASHAIRLKRGSCKIGCQTSSTSSSNNLKIMGQPKPQVPRLRSFLSVEKSSTSNLSRFNSKSKMSNSSFSSMAGRNASFQLPNQNSSGMSRNASFGGSHLRLGQNRSCSVPTINDSTSSMNWNGSGVMQMAQRSNGATVKAVIASLKRRCEAAAEEPASSGADTTSDDRKVPIAECSMLKLKTADLMNEIGYKCQQMFGGYGFMEEYPMARLFRDSRLGPIGGGTSEIMREIIAKMIFEKKEYKAIT